MNKDTGVAFVLGIEEHQIMNHLTRDFAAGFKEIGFNAHAVHHAEFTSIQDYAGILKEINCGLIVNLAGLGLDHIAEVQKEYGIDTPVVTMMMDPVIIYWPRVVAPVKNNYVTGLSQYDADFISAHAAEPKGAFTLRHASSEKEFIPWNEKDIGLFYCGSLRTPPEKTRASWGNYKPGIEQVFNDILDSHIDSGYKNLMDDVTKVLNQRKAPYTLAIFRQFFMETDSYLRDYHRAETVKKS